MQITICYGDVIDSILFESKSREGVIGSSVKIGGPGGTGGAIGGVPGKFCIDSSVEQLSSISLTYGDYYGHMAIREICFFTNLKTYGPFGTISGDSSLYIPIKWGVIVGFHGRGGIYLNAIGIFVAPKVNNFSSSEKKFNSLHSVQDPDYAPTQLKGKIIDEEGLISLGPWGGKGGAYSTYKLEGPMMQITILYGDVIESILFESKSHEGVVIGSSVKFGRSVGSASAEFCIDSSVEQFSSVSLTYKDYDEPVVLTSLCFNTNIKKYGPFGSGGGHSVSIPIEGGVIAGFHGRGGRLVDAIGILVAPKVKHTSSKALKIKTLKPFGILQECIQQESSSNRSFKASKNIQPKSSTSPQITEKIPPFDSRSSIKPLFQQTKRRIRRLYFL